jgi:hypothetical protein
MTNQSTSQHHRKCRQNIFAMMSRFMINSASQARILDSLASPNNVASFHSLAYPDSLASLASWICR